MPSDYRYSGIKRRDERNTKIEPRKPGGSKRNTRRWCRGVVGREHEPVAGPYSEGSIYTDWQLLACAKCGKVMDSYCPVSWLPAGLCRAKPDWAK